MRVSAVQDGYWRVVMNAAGGIELRRQLEAVLQRLLVLYHHLGECCKMFYG